MSTRSKLFTFIKENMVTEIKSHCDKSTMPVDVEYKVKYHARTYVVSVKYHLAALNEHVSRLEKMIKEKM